MDKYMALELVAIISYVFYKALKFIDDRITKAKDKRDLSERAL